MCVGDWVVSWWGCCKLKKRSSSVKCEACCMLDLQANSRVHKVLEFARFVGERKDVTY